jgi:hypothetical protein
LLIGSFPFLGDDAFGADRGSKADYRGNYANAEGPVGLKIGGGGPEHLAQTALASDQKVGIGFWKSPMRKQDQSIRMFKLERPLLQL